jgi:hypothetical protein
MTPRSDRCQCAKCGVECTGRFLGCSLVWAASPTMAAPVRPSGTGLGDVQSALHAIRAEIEELRAMEDRPPPDTAAMLPTYEHMLDLKKKKGRRSRWWKRHRAQHLG